MATGWRRAIPTWPCSVPATSTNGAIPRLGTNWRSGKMASRGCMVMQSGIGHTERQMAQPTQSSVMVGMCESLSNRIAWKRE